MNGYIESVDYRGHTIALYQDDDPLHPREDYDNLGIMVCGHRRYHLGDVQATEAEIEKAKRAAFYLPLYLLDHSGITMRTTSFNDPWDSGQVGVIYTTRKKAIEWFGKRYTDMQVYDALRSEVEIYDQYLRGDIYGYNVDGDGDSFWGFYGRERAIEAGKEHVDWMIEQYRKEHMRRVKAWIRNKVPLAHREAFNAG